MKKMFRKKKKDQKRLNGKEQKQEKTGGKKTE